MNEFPTLDQAPESPPKKKIMSKPGEYKIIRSSSKPEDDENLVGNDFAISIESNLSKSKKWKKKKRR